MNKEIRYKRAKLIALIEALNLGTNDGEDRDMTRLEGELFYGTTSISYASRAAGSPFGFYYPANNEQWLKVWVNLWKDKDSVIVTKLRNSLRYMNIDRRNSPQGRTMDSLNVSFMQKIKSAELTPKALHYQRAVGIEIEGYTPSRNKLSDKLPYFSRTASDSSINPPYGNEDCEVRMLLNRGAMEPRLSKILSILNSNTFGHNRSCGLHVHMEASHLSMVDRAKKQMKMIKWLRLLKKFVPESRRDNTYCKLDGDARSLKNSRYAAVNIQTGPKNTIEVRLHSSTTNQTKIMMWVRLCELLFVLEAPKASVGADLAALEGLPLCEWDKSYWRQRFADLNPATINHASTTEEGE
jgi:hypothetical protein